MHLAHCSGMVQTLGEHSHLLTVVTNRFSYLQVEAMINVGPLFVLEFIIELGMFQNFLFLFLFFT